MAQRGKLSREFPILVSSTQKEEKKGKQRERIQLLETRPKPEWFVKDKDEGGRTVWFLRFEVTGLLPRRFGPFNTKRKALLCLDRAINHLADGLSEMNNDDKDILSGPFRHTGWDRPIIEDHVGSAYRRQRA